MSQTKKKKVAFLHTAYPIIGQLKPLIKEIVPDINVMNILDDDILPYISKSKGITHEVNRKIFRYVLSAQEMGVSAVILTCSSISPCADFVSPLVNIPVLKIDKPMIENAVQIGNNIGVIATISTTLNPTKDFIIGVSRKKDKQIIIKDCLCEDAFKAFLSGNIEEHDESIISGIKNLSNEVDVIVLAQVSMARIIPQLESSLKIPVLTSPKSGIEQLRKVLNLP